MGNAGVTETDGIDAVYYNPAAIAKTSRWGVHAVLGLGTLYQVSDAGLRIGASLSNFGTQAAFAGRDLHVTFDTDPTRNGDNGTLPAEQATGNFPVPVLFRVGLGLPLRLDADHELRLAVDAQHPSDNTESLSA